MKAKGTRKVQTIKNPMRDQTFADLRQALEDALAFERGERRDLKVTRIQGSRQPNASRRLSRRVNPKSRF